MSTVQWWTGPGRASAPDPLPRTSNSTAVAATGRRARPSPTRRRSLPLPRPCDRLGSVVEVLDPFPHCPLYTCLWTEPTSPFEDRPQHVRSIDDRGPLPGWDGIRQGEASTNHEARSHLHGTRDLRCREKNRGWEETSRCRTHTPSSSSSLPDDVWMKKRVFVHDGTIRTMRPRRTTPWSWLPRHRSKVHEVLLLLPHRPRTHLFQPSPSRLLRAWIPPSRHRRRHAGSFLGRMKRRHRPSVFVPAYAYGQLPQGR